MKSQQLKSLIQQRQKALAKGHDQLFKSLRITASIGNENNAGINTLTQIQSTQSLQPQTVVEICISNSCPIKWNICSNGIK